MGKLSKGIRLASAIWLVVVFLGLILGIPYVLDRMVESSPLEDPVVQLLFLLVASSIPAPFGLAYATHRRRVEYTEEWLADLR